MGCALAPYVRRDTDTLRSLVGPCGTQEGQEEHRGADDCGHSDQERHELGNTHPASSSSIQHPVRQCRKNIHKKSKKVKLCGSIIHDRFRLSHLEEGGGGSCGGDVD